MFTLLCVIVVWLIVVDFIVMIFSSKSTRCPFLQLNSLAHLLRISGPPLERAVQEASVNVKIYLSRSVPGREYILCKFNFGVSMGGLR